MIPRVYAQSDTGRVRNHNEDSYFIGRNIFAVADGMGGHAAGEVASKAALEGFQDLDSQQFETPEDTRDQMIREVQEANSRVHQRANDNPEQSGMGTTLTAIMVRNDSLYLAHVGDSRAYLLRNEKLEQITTDHTLVNQLINEGKISPTEAKVHPYRSVITRAIGVDPFVSVDTLEEPKELFLKDRILLCSDGLCGPVDDDQISQILMSENQAEKACKRLIDLANANGGPDNITVVVVDICDESDLDESTMPIINDEAATAELADPQDIAEHTPPKSGQVVIDNAPPLVEKRNYYDNRNQTKKDSNKQPINPIVWLGISVFVVLVVLFSAHTVLNNQFYVSIDEQGNIAVYRGLKDQYFFGQPLYSVVDTHAIKAKDLSKPLQESLADGVSQKDLESANKYVTDTLKLSIDKKTSSDNKTSSED